MKYLLCIVLLVAVLLTAGCVGGNNETITPPGTTTQTPTVAASPVKTPVYPARAETVSTTAVITTNGFSQKGQVQCGENHCPPSWFCCNNICYDPSEGNTGYCCGTRVCPKTWGCMQTGYGNTCYENPPVQYTRIPGNNSQYCTSNYPGTVYNPSTNTCDHNNYGFCAYYYPGTQYNPSKNQCLYPTRQPTPVNEYEYCARTYPGSHYNPSTNSCQYPPGVTPTQSS